MKKPLYIILIILLISIMSCNKNQNSIIESNFKFAQNQYRKMLEKLPDANKLPRTIEENGQLKTVSSSDWTSGFFPGALWYIFEYTNKQNWKNAAEKYTQMLKEERYNSGTHDIGFMMFCSYGNGYRLTKNSAYRDILITSAKTLSTRFDSTVGCIKSWDWNEEVWQFPVIIDNMMNLELLFWASEVTGNPKYHDIAVSHANTTIEHHFRKDYSTYHVVNYDTTTGKVINKQTWQGYADSSCWSRGQAWALYGYTMCYRFTNDNKYLEQAQHIAEYILNHDNLPADMVPYWDFNVPNIPDTPRDASAAAIIASSLYELDNYADNKNYRKAADKILLSLSSKKYKSHRSNFILDHSVGSKPSDSEVNVPLIYADYYFLEANLRKQKFRR